MDTIILVLSTLLILALFINLIVYHWTCNVDTNRITLSFKNLPESFDGYKIIQLSDLHSFNQYINTSKLINDIKKESPDIIVITGDITNNSVEKNKERIEFLNSLSEIASCYYVYGNHDVFQIQVEKRKYKEPLFEKELEKTSLINLNNSFVTISKDKESIKLFGLNDDSSPEVIKKVNENDFAIVLSHRPNDAERLSEKNLALMLCGHTHGGQIKFSFFRERFKSGREFKSRHIFGEYNINNMKLICNKGIGCSRIPIRIISRAEIISLILKRD